MYKINTFENVEVDSNKIIVDKTKSKMLENSEIIFNGINNILYVEDGVILKKSNIIFNGSNSIIYISRNVNPYYFSVKTNNNNVFYVGSNCFFNPKGGFSALLSEQQNVIIGEDGLFSFGIKILTADGHIIYSTNTKDRINQSKSVLIGDHVWIGQNAVILKGTKIGSGAIVGANSIASNKKIESNFSVAGNPIKTIRKDVFFSKELVHNWTEQETENYKEMDTNQWVYESTSNTFDFEKIDIELKLYKDVDEKLKKLIELIVENKEKNRFFI
ncbi:MAG: acyltransferase [Lachnospirales bacterium]